MSRNPQQGPGYQPIKVITNSFEIPQLPVKSYYQYDVFDPLEGKPNKRNQLIHHLQNAVAPDVFNPRVVYDGQAILYSPRRLPLADNGNGTFIVRLGSTPPVALGSKGSYEIRLTLTAGEQIKASHVTDLVKDGKNTPRALQSTNLMQLIFRQGPNQCFTKNNRAYFTGADNKVLQGTGLELSRGTFQSVRPTLGKMILTMDTSTAVLFQGGPLLDRFMEILRSQNLHDLELQPQDPKFIQLEKVYQDTLLRIKTGNNRSRVKTFHGLVSRAADFQFLQNGAQETTVGRYFLEAHGIILKYPHIVGVRLSGRKSERQDVVPLELCEIIPGQFYKRRIPEYLTNEMVKFASIRPEDRLKKITNAVNNYRNSEFVVESGMTVNTNPMILNAKILNPPIVFFGGGAVRFQNGAWNALRQNFKESCSLDYWIVADFTRLREGDVERMTDGLMRSCKNLGMRMTTNKPHLMKGNPQTPEKTLNTVMENWRRTIKGEITKDILGKLIIVVILPNNAGLIRNAVKYWGDIENGVQTQCLRESQLVKANDHYFNNVALKLNARSGATNFYSNSSALERLRAEPYMIIGADVGHPGPKIQKPSVIGIVYSYDKFATKYRALTGIQPPRIEQIQNLRHYIKKAVEDFGNTMGCSPKRLIFFRDGLSEGEYEGVALQEIAEIQEAFKDLWAERKIDARKHPMPTLTFIVVGKRHHAVFFPLPGEGDKTGNCLPGSLIDNGITHPVYPNFYLQSHAAIKGTSRSSHYIVLRNDNSFEIEFIQEFAYTLCHVYAKATRSVSIPAPVYYADLVCSRGSFHVDPRKNLQFDDDVSTVSGSSKKTLDMKPWQLAFKGIHPTLEKSMYFL